MRQNPNTCVACRLFRVHVCKAGVTHFHARQCSEKRMGGGGGREGKALNLRAGFKQFLV